MLVKDLTETAGIRTTFSCKAFADYVPERDAAVVRRMKEAGFVVLGKSNTPEFGIDRDHRVGAERRLPQPVGHLAHPGRLVGRRRRGSRRGLRCRSRTAPTAAARSAFPPPRAASSG